MTRPAKKLAQLQAEVGKYRDYIETHQLEFYNPYPKQLEFHAAGKTFYERLFLAGNQTGKTYSCGAEVSMHLTGRYPENWPGKKFPRSNNWWISSEAGDFLRDNAQRILIGSINDPGRSVQPCTATIPKECIKDITLNRQVTDLIDTMEIEHETGKSSFVWFKSYREGRKKWAAATLTGGIWFDEEPDIEIYSEGLVRLSVYGGISIISATPMLGSTGLILQFLQPAPDDPPRNYTKMSIREAEHFTRLEPEAQQRWLSKFPPQERKSRLDGDPFLGSGNCYPVSEESLKVEPFSIPKYWKKIWGLDLGGGNHPTAQSLLAYDQDNDVVYVVHTYKNPEPSLAVHAASLTARGRWIPIAWPKDALSESIQIKASDTKQIKQMYQDLGCAMLYEHAQYADDRGNGVEAGIWDILQRMQTGRFKVFSHLNDWFSEVRTYHRKDGKIAKVQDDLMDATRYAVMMIRYAKSEVMEQDRPRRYDRKKPSSGRSWMSH